MSSARRPAQKIGIHVTLYELSRLYLEIYLDKQKCAITNNERKGHRFEGEQAGVYMEGLEGGKRRENGENGVIKLKSQNKLKKRKIREAYLEAYLLDGSLFC